MSAAKHTPGPWEAHTFSLTTADRKHRLAHFGPINGKARGDSTRESEANCVLAASAPEQHEAVAMSTAQLMSAAELLKKHGEHRAAASCLSQCDFNRSIIAKAEGRTA